MCLASLRVPYNVRYIRRSKKRVAIELYLGGIKKIRPKESTLEIADQLLIPETKLIKPEFALRQKLF